MKIPFPKTPVAQAVSVCLMFWHRPDALKRSLLIYNNIRDAREKG